MLLDDKKEFKKRGKKGLFVLTQNLVILIIILVLIGVVSYIIFKAINGRLVPIQ